MIGPGTERIYNFNNATHGPFLVQYYILEISMRYQYLNESKVKSLFGKLQLLILDFCHED